MRILRWELWLCLLFGLLSTSTTAADIYSSQMLTEADNLVEIVPNQAKLLTTTYLTQRRLSARGEKSPSSISRDETDSRLRTPGSTIDALKILAQAEFNLGNTRNALLRIQEAEQLTQKYQLPYLSLDVQLLKIRLRWLNDHDAFKANVAIDELEQAYQNIRNPEQLAKGLRYDLTMFKAEVASRDGDLALANQLYSSLKSYLTQSNSATRLIDYHTQVGKHYLINKRYNRALFELLIAYWKAIEENASRELAKVNQLLGQLFYERRVLDKANDHLSQAADFYDNYEHSPVLPTILKMMGDTYYHQGKFNLALVHYFNAIDHERIQQNLESVIELRLALAATYLQLVNYPLAEQYLVRAQDLLEFTDIPSLKSQALLLESGLAYHQKKPELVTDKARQALAIAQQVDDISKQKDAYQLLYLGYELSGKYDRSLTYLKKFNALTNIEKRQLDLISEDAFRQQKEFVEQTLHLVGQKEQLAQTQSEFQKFQQISFALFLFCAVLFMWVLRRGHVMRVQKDEIAILNEDLFTHSRSGLRNLRMLNAKLPASLEQSSHKFEKWHVGELIHEPLNDRLRFVMIDVPFLRNMYLQFGYAEGLKLEKAFGDYLNERVEAPARIYHFSDANLLYVEPNADGNTDPEVICNKIQHWILEFAPKRSLNRIVRIGMADYPFLPRAYTAINDKELVDILLMSTGAARTLSMKEHSSQWVYLKAIENAPAASLATGNIRKACKHSINQGLIKVHSSYKNEESIKKLLKDE
ncbi:tetratricopeptide repeat protein [Vibrio sp. TRT 17S01]|uniref:tetratricopeptide repeat protein n=1 Tax=Vibrio sp. TRT 17S01 TaxID=3418505 RepID=UPI003CF91B1F